MKKLYILLSLTLSTLFYAQVEGVGIGTDVIDPSAILEVSNSTNQGVLLPQVILTEDVFDTQIPVENPAEGLVVFNIGGAQVPGYYYWANGRWNLLADNYNNITDLVVLGNNVNETLFSGVANDTFVSSTSGLDLFSNNIKLASYDSGSNVFTLPEGTYTIQVNVDFTIPNLTADVLQAGSGINLYKMKSRLTDVNGQQISSETIDISTLNNSSKKGTFVFEFELNVTDTQDFKIEYAPTSGGTYENGVGGSGANDGSINIVNYKVHVQKSLLL